MVEDNPLVSVVMPVYNVAPWVEAAVLSILRQTYSNLELIVVDDGSRDDTVERVEGIRDPRLRLLRLEHQGQFKARNVGILEARGDWVAGMDGDDISHPDRLKAQIDLLRSNPGCVLCGTKYGYISPRGRVVQWRFELSNRALTPSLLSKSMRCADASMVFHRNLAIDVGLFDVDIPMNEKSLWYKLLRRGTGFLLESCYYFVRLREGSANIGQLGGARRRRAVCKRYDPEGYEAKYGNSPVSSVQALQLKGIRKKLWIYRAAGDYSSALSCVMEAWKSQPARVAFYVLLEALTGYEHLRFWRGAKSSRFADLVLYRPENDVVARFLRSFGLKV